MLTSDLYIRSIPYFLLARRNFYYNYYLPTQTYCFYCFLISSSASLFVVWDCSCITKFLLKIVIPHSLKIWLSTKTESWIRIVNRLESYGKLDLPIHIYICSLSAWQFEVDKCSIFVSIFGTLSKAVGYRGICVYIKLSSYDSPSP